VSAFQNIIDYGVYDSRYDVINPNWIECMDGFRLSVVAGSSAYCHPRAANAGPYSLVEVGFPSQRPEPWDQWVKYLDGLSRDTSEFSGVYGYVPVQMVRALIDLHGGEIGASEQ
jgi:hypothetical protein